MSRFDPNNNSRVVQLIDTDGTTVVETLVNDASGTDLIDNFTFQLLRQGGCGGASLRVDKPFEYEELTQDRYIKATYNGEDLYFGRIESVSGSTPSGWDVTCYGLMSILAEIPIGGLGPYDTRVPHLFARDDYYVNDPDHDLQSWDTISNYTSFVQLLYDKYISPKGISQGTIESPDSEVDLYSLVFRGEETLSQVLRAVAAVQYGASYGINGAKQFFFLNKNSTPEYGSSSNDYSMFQEGRDITALSQTQDRSIMYNRVLITGGYVHGVNVPGAGAGGGYYRYRAPVYTDQASIATYGDRPVSIYVPWIRSNKEALAWVNRFFDDYAGPRTRYTFTTLPQRRILTPWGGAVTLYSAANNTLVTDTFDEVEIVFEEAPYCKVTTGVEELQYPIEPEPQRWELQPAQWGGGDRENVDGGDSLTGDLSFSFDEPQYTRIVKDVRCSSDQLVVEYIECQDEVLREIED